VIPPAWTNVEITTNKRAKILAVGRVRKVVNNIYITQDSVRKKMLTNLTESFISQKILKHERVTGQHLRKKKMSREKVLAAMVRLLDSAYFRPGPKVHPAKQKLRIDNHPKKASQY
jgi:DNA topoisomerase-1